MIVSLQDSEDRLFTSLSSNRVEAEVIVHSELSDPGREKAERCAGKENESSAPRGPSLPEVRYSSLSPPGEALEKLSLAQSPLSLPSIKLVAIRNVESEDTGDKPNSNSELQQDTGLTNGFHSPKAARSPRMSEHLENGDSRHCPSAPGKAMSAGLSPAPFVSAGLVHTTSAAHSYLCQ